MVEFFQTRMGKQFFDGTMPRIAKALEKIGDALTSEGVKLQKALLESDIDEVLISNRGVCLDVDDERRMLRDRLAAHLLRKYGERI